MQNLHPIHLSPFQVTGPSFVLYIALTRQAATQAGCQQCIHCRFTNTSPFSVLKRLTIVHCLSSVSRSFSSALSFLMSGTKLSCATEHATSQDRHPIHRVVSTSTPMNSLFSFVLAAFDCLMGRTAAPTAAPTVAEVLKNCLLSTISPVSEASGQEQSQRHRFVRTPLLPFKDRSLADHTGHDDFFPE